MIFRFLFLAFLFYLAMRILSSVFKSEKKVSGKSPSKPLNYTDKDVQDIDYKEYDDKDKD